LVARRQRLAQGPGLVAVRAVGMIGKECVDGGDVVRAPGRRERARRIGRAIGLRLPTDALLLGLPASFGLGQPSRLILVGAPFGLGRALPCLLLGVSASFGFRQPSRLLLVGAPLGLGRALSCLLLRLPASLAFGQPTRPPP